MTRARVAAVLAAAIGAAGAPAAAQDQPVDLEEGYSAERFRPAIDHRGILDVESAEVGEPFEIELGLTLGYADDPLNLYRDGAIERQRVGSLVSHRLGGNLIGAVSFLGRLQLGLDLPVVLSQDEAPGVLMTTPPSISSFGLGDLRVVPKLLVIPPDRKMARIAVAVALGFTVPTGSADSYFGDDGGTLAPELLVSAPLGPRGRAGLNLGYRVRRERQTLDLEVDDELFAHLGAAYQMTPRLELLATFSLAAPASDPAAGVSSLFSELRGGASYRLGNLVVFGALGAGTSEGFGAPDWRAVTGVRFALPRTAARAVRARPPELVVRVPREPPPPATAESDRDGDGVADADDRCPDDAEDLDGFDDADGCPDADNDGDAIADGDDACPLEAGTAEQRGCPIADRDGDGVADTDDNYPDEAGTAANRGCVKKQLAAVSATGIAVLENVQFETNRAAVRLRSYPLLRNVAELLKSHPEIALLKIEGHTDSVGDDAANLALSRRRAETVKDFLIAQGIKRDRLEAVGLGETKPIADNKTAAGRAKNRRVEFVIQRRAE